MSNSNLKHIQGLQLFLEFITPQEEKNLVASFVETTPKKTTGRNSIRRFGSKAPYRANMVSEEIPAQFDFLLDRLVNQQLMPIRPDSVSINEYLCGQGIQAHIDSRESGKTITVLSLTGNATMVFSNGNTNKKIDLPPRCLLQMKDESRNIWKHSIEPVKHTRYSVVFRCSKDIE